MVQNTLAIQETVSISSILLHIWQLLLVAASKGIPTTKIAAKFPGHYRISVFYHLLYYFLQSVHFFCTFKQVRSHRQAVLFVLVIVEQTWLRRSSFPNILLKWPDMNQKEFLPLQLIVTPMSFYTKSLELSVMASVY
jgi:hypothetical protein